MKNIAFSIMLTLFALAAFGQNTAVPGALQLPEAGRVILHTYAKGVQIYSFTQNGDDTTKFMWVLKEPRASLYADSNYVQQVGKHYYNKDKKPVWEATDGSKVTGIKIAQADAPDGQSIPWLLLKTIILENSGKLNTTAFIRRIYTKGGNAPALPGNVKKGQLVEVPYTAEYIFYSKN